MDNNNSENIKFVDFLDNSFMSAKIKELILFKNKEKKIFEAVKKRKFYSINKINANYQKAIQNINKYVRAYKVELKLNSKQINMLKIWLNVATIVYDKCVYYYNEKKGNLTLDYKKLKLEIFKLIPKQILNLCPYNILTYEVKEFCSNIKSCRTQMKQKYISHYLIKFRKLKENRTINIEKKNINNYGFYPRFMGKVNYKDKLFSFSKITSDCKLTFNYKNNKCFLFIPQYISGKIVSDRKKIVSLDPGESTFMTFYSLDHMGMIGKDLRHKILIIESKIRSIQRNLSKCNKNRNKKRMKDAIRRKYRRIKGIIRELHNKTALFLCKNYNIILIPEFKTSQMVSDKKRIFDKIKQNKDTIKKEAIDKSDFSNKLKQYKKRNRLNARVKFMLNQLSHYKFKQQLFSKGEEYGCLVKEVTEEFTSKCCGQCGHLSDKYIKRMKECENCGFKINRDYNGSRNIMIKNIDLVTKLRVNPKGR